MAQKLPGYPRNVLPMMRGQQAYLESLGQQAPTGRISGPPMPQRVSELGYIEGLAKTAAWELGPGAVGIEPGKALRKFEEDNPIASALASLTGTLGMYSIPMIGMGSKAGALGFRAALKTPGLKRLATFALENRTERVVASTVAKEIATFAPLEGTRVALAGVLGDEGALGRTASEAAFNLTAFGILGGGLAAMSKSLPVPSPRLSGDARLQKLWPEYPADSIPQERLASILEIRGKTQRLPDTEDLFRTMDGVEPGLRALIYHQEATSGKEVVGSLAGMHGKRRAALVNSVLGKTGRHKGLAVRKYVEGRGGFKDSKDMLAALESTPYIRENLHDVSLPRHIKTDSKAGRDRLVQMRKDSGMAPVSRRGAVPDGWMTREKDGMFAVLKRIKPRGKGRSAGDEYVFFRTQIPTKFFPDATGMGRNMHRNAMAITDDLDRTAKELRTPLTNYQDQILRLMPKYTDLRGLPPSATAQLMSRTFAKVGPMVGVEGMERIPLNAANWVGSMNERVLRRFLSPLISRFAKSPKALAVATHANNMTAFAKGRARVLWLGAPAFSPRQQSSLFRLAVATPQREGSLQAMLIKAWRSENGAAQLNRIQRESMSMEEILNAGFNKEVVDFTKHANMVYTRQIDDMAKIHELLEVDLDAVPEAYHLVAAQGWRGKHRLPIYRKGDPNDVVGYASGRNRTETLEEATQRIASANKAAEEAGNPLRLEFNESAMHEAGDPERVRRALSKKRAKAESEIDALEVQLDELSNDAYRATNIRPDSPAAELWRLSGRSLRANAQGKYITDVSLREYQQGVLSNIVDNENYMAAQLVRHRMADMMTEVRQQSPEVFKSLDETLAAMYGSRGRLARMADKILDPVLGPFMGADSASRIVQTANRVMFGLTLGAGDVGFAALNVLTPIQTVLPELAFVLKAPTAKLKGYYEPVLIMGRDSAHVVHALDPLRILGKATRSLWKPSEGELQAIMRAKENGWLDAQLIEALVGHNGEAVKTFKTTLEQDGVSAFLLKLSEWGPQKSEELSRSVAFLAGRRMGKDMLGLSDDLAYEMGVTMMRRTMFEYNTAARPRVITGAFGSALGLFKNWSMHYIANMTNYAGEAARGNFAPLLWMMAGTGSMAGAIGLPGYGVINKLSGVLSDRTLVENLYEGFGYTGEGSFGDRMTDSLFYGLPAFAGVTLQARAAAPGAAFIRDTNMLFDLAILDRAQALGAALGSLVDTWDATGRHPIQNQAVRDKFMKAFFPRTLARFMSRTADGGIRSLKTQNKIISDISIPKTLVFASGLQPVDIEKGFEAQQILWERQGERRRRTSAAGAALAEAWANKDPQAARRIIIRNMADGGDTSGAINSASTRYRNLTRPTIERQFEEADVQQVLGPLLGKARRR